MLVGGQVSTSSSSSSKASAGLDLVLGLLAVFYALRMRAKARQGGEQATPGWMKRLDTMSPVAAFALGMFLPPYLVAVAIGNDIVRQNLSTASRVVAMSLYVIVGSIGILIPILVTVLRPSSSDRGPGVVASVAAGELADVDGVAIHRNRCVPGGQGHHRARALIERPAGGTSWKKIAHPSIEERKAQGKDARLKVEPSGHAGWVPAADRPDPVALLEEQNATREPDLVPVRHGRMMVSPFTFYRGAAKIMAADLKDTPTAGLDVQLCGDAHLSNFGVFASPERTLLFDLNDFDETLPGPFEYDVKRMAASFTIAARNNGFTEGRCARRDARVGRGLSRGDGQVRRDAHAGHLVRAPVGSRTCSTPSTPRQRSSKGTGKKRAKARREERREGRREGAHPRQLAGAVEAGRARRRPVPDRQPAADRRPAA